MSITCILYPDVKRPLIHVGPGPLSVTLLLPLLYLPQPVLPQLQPQPLPQPLQEPLYLPRV